MILHIVIEGRLHKLNLEAGRPGGGFVCEVDGARLEGSAHLLEPGVLSLLIAGESYRCLLDQGGEESAVHIDGQRFAFRVEDARSLKGRLAHGGGASGPRSIKAPMPGRVVRLLVEPGAHVEAQQGVLVIEAMKMQNELRSPKAGKVVELRATAGTTVAAGEVLAVID